MRRYPKGSLATESALYPEQPGVDYQRPATRGECANGPRPCPFVSCRHHLYLDVSSSTGAIKLNFPDLEVWEMKESCSLDVADRGGNTLEHVADALNVVRERVRTFEAEIIAGPQFQALRDHYEPEAAPLSSVRRLPILDEDFDALEEFQ